MIENLPLDRPLDKTGFPIREGARVHVGPRVTSFSSIPVTGFGGTVVQTYQSERHGWVVQIREFDSWARRDVRADVTRIQRGGGTEKQKLDQEVYERVAKRSKRKK